MKKAIWSFFLCVIASVVIGGGTVYFVYSVFILPSKDATIQLLQQELQLKQSIPHTNALSATTNDVAQRLVIDDIPAVAFPYMQVDFRVSNPSSASISISRVYFLILRIDPEQDAVPVGKQEISDTAAILLTTNLVEGDLLQTSIAVDVPAGGNDRFTVIFNWDGQPQARGHLYTVVPALKTSTGFVQSDRPIRLYIQRQWPDNPNSPPFHPKPMPIPSGNPVTKAVRDNRYPSWGIMNWEVAPIINWEQETKYAQPPL